MMTHPRAAASPPILGANPGITPPTRSRERNAAASPLLEQWLKDVLVDTGSAPVPTLASMTRAAGLSSTTPQSSSARALVKEYGIFRRRRQLRDKYAAVFRALHVALDLVRHSENNTEVPPQRLLVRQVMTTACVAKHVATSAVASVVNNSLTNYTGHAMTPPKKLRDSVAASSDGTTIPNSDTASAIGMSPEECPMNALLLLATDMLKASTADTCSGHLVSEWTQRLWSCQLNLLDLIRICEQFADGQATTEDIQRLRARLARVMGQESYVNRKDRAPRQSHE
jgi:hypothetical protein